MELEVDKRNGTETGGEVAYRELVEALSGARRRLARSKLVGGLIRWICVAGGGLAVALVLAALLPSSVPGSWTISLVWVSLAITAFGAYIVLPLMRLPGVDGMAVRLDSAIAPGANRLISSLQLGRELKQGSVGANVSAPIAEKAVEMGAVEARGMETAQVTRDSGLGRWIRQLAVVAVFAAALAVIWPGEMKTSAWKLANPMACGPSPIQLVAGPGDAEVDAGADLVVEAVVTGTEIAPELRVRKRGGVWRRAPMNPVGKSPSRLPGGFVNAPSDLPTEDGEKRRDGSSESGAPENTPSVTVRTPDGPRELPRHSYSFVLKNLQEDREYNVVVAEQSSPTWNIDVNQPPRAVAFRMNYTFPEYTGLPPHETVSATGDIAALKGASVELEISANRKLEAARLSFAGTAAAGEKPEAFWLAPTTDKSFVGAFRLMAEDSYTITFVEPGGRERSDIRSFKITPLPDQRPLVRIISPGRSIDLPTDMAIEVSAYAADDFGVSSMSLIYFMEGGEETHIPLKTYSSAPRELYESYPWDLTELGLLPGEVVFYSVEVRDNDTVSGPKSSRSDVHSLRFPTMAEIFQQVGEDYEEGIDELADQLRKGQELKDKLEEISRELRKSDELSWEQRQSIKGALGDREKLEDAVKEVTDSLDEIVEKMGGSELVDQEMVDKIMEIQKLLSEITDPEVRKAIDQLNEAMAGVDKEEIAKAMEKLQLDHENLLKKLDKTIELLKKLKAEEQLAAVQEEIQELLKKQESISDSLEKDDPDQDAMENLANEEDGVKDGIGELEKSLTELAGAMQDIDEQTAEEMRKQAEKASDEGLQKDAEKASSEMRAASNQGAMQACNNVAKGLSSMSEQMESTMDSMQQRQNQQMAKELGDAAKDLVFISKGQEGMVASSDAASPQELARSQFQIHSGAAQVADDLEEVIRGSFSLSRRLTAELGDALHKMEKATKDFEAGKKNNGLKTSWDAVPALNRAAIQLMKASSEMQAMSMSSCMNPNGKDAARQEMQKLCGMQQGVNMDTQGMVQKMSREGGRLQQSTEESLAKLAARQEMIRQGMKEVSGELGDSKDVLGRLDKLAEDMQNIVDELEGKDIDRETVRRQQRILSRMLDAQRSVRRRDMDNERISRVGNDELERLSPGAIPPELLEASDRVKSEILQGKADSIPPAYRRLVEEYFRAISARGF
jgi:hypothetical protein